MTESSLSDEELLRCFEDMSLPAAVFDHRQHVRVAWLFVRRDGMPDALGTFSAALRRFADGKGAQELFHVTVTWAYLLLINERDQLCPHACWESFAARNADLLSWKPSILDAYYTSNVLWSDRARQAFVMPDRVLAR